MSAILILGFGQLYPHPILLVYPWNKNKEDKWRSEWPPLQKQSGQVGNEQTGGQRFAGMAAMSVCAWSLCTNFFWLISSIIKSALYMWNTLQFSAKKIPLNADFIHWENNTPFFIQPP